MRIDEVLDTRGMDVRHCGVLFNGVLDVFVCKGFALMKMRFKRLICWRMRGIYCHRGENCWDTAMSFERQVGERTTL